MTTRFDLDHDLELEFSRSNTEFAVSHPKVARLPQNEKQAYRLNSRPQMWPSGLTLAMTLPWIFKVKYGICYISTKWSDCHETKSKQIDWTLTFEFSRSNVILTIWSPRSGVRIYQMLACRRLILLTVKVSIGLDNGLALNMQQAIIWTNVGITHRRIYVIQPVQLNRYRRVWLSNYIHCFMWMWLLIHALNSMLVHS